MENNTTNISWLHGLQDYFEFSGNDSGKSYVDFLLKMIYANEPIININETGSLEELVGTMRKYISDETLDNFYKYYRLGYEPDALKDAFSRGQVKSKIWLVTELAKVKTDFSNVFLMAGWFGQLRKYFDVAGIVYKEMKVVDIDPVACQVSDQIFNSDFLKGYKVKSVELDLTNMEWLYRTGCQYIVKNYNNGSSYEEKSVPDLIVNTSAEHFHERWYHKFVNRPQETDPLFVIQTNNLHDVPDHINSVYSLDEMKKKFPMSRIDYEGELELFGYKRYMLIGRP